MKNQNSSLSKTLGDWPLTGGRLSIGRLSHVSFNARPWHWVSIFGICVAALSGQHSQASNYYDYRILAQTGQAGLVGIKTAPSINNAGNVGFIGLIAGGEGVFFADGQTVVNLSPAHASRTFSTSFQLNDFNTVVARDSFGGIFNIRFWIADAPGSFTDVDSTTGIRQSFCTGGNFAGQPCSTSFNCPDLFVPGLFYPCSQPPQSHFVGLLFPTINNRSEVAYIGGLTGTTSNVLTFVGRNGPREYRLLGGYNTMRTPALADDGRIVARAGSSSSSPILLLERNLVSAAEIVSSANGFTTIGQLPGISDDGSIVAFAANRGSGTGVFVSFEASPGNRVIVRIAGENQGSPRPELGYNDQAQPLYFSSLDIDNRISVIRDELGAAGLEGDNVVVCFTATPNAASGTSDPDGLKFNANRGLWAVRLNTAQSLANPGTLELTPINPLPVMQIGDSISTPAGNRVVDNVSSFDALASVRRTTQGAGNAVGAGPSIELPRLGDHQVGFLAASGAERFVIRADPCPCAVNQTIPRPANRSLPNQAIQNGWSMDVVVSDDDGLVLTNVWLRNRHMAESMSLPYLRLNTYAAGGSSIFNGRFELKPDGTENVARARLVDFKTGIIADAPNTPFGIEATYVVDRIGKSCLRVTQQYLFNPLIDGDRLEISGTLKGHRFFPIVKYEFCGRDGETLESLRAAQRLHFQVDGVAENNAALFKDVSCIPLNEFPFFDCITAGFRNQNPLLTEAIVPAIVNGTEGTVDNLHQTWNEKIDEPVRSFFSTFSLAGCPECVHIHWRWLDFLFGVLGDPFNGKPIVPLRSRGYDYDSNQDVEVALVQYKPGEEDPMDVSDLVSIDQIAGADQVFWYVSTGKRNEDMFFLHGGFFKAEKTSSVGSRILNGVFEVFINAPPGRSASILESIDAMQTWTPVSTFTVTSPVMSFSYPLRNSGAVFYRAVLLP